MRDLSYRHTFYDRTGRWWGSDGKCGPDDPMAAACTWCEGDGMEGTCRADGPCACCQGTGYVPAGTPDPDGTIAGTEDQIACVEAAWAEIDKASFKLQLPLD